MQYLKKQYEILKTFLTSYDLEYVEMMSAVLAMLWGIFLLLPLDSFSAGSTFCAMKVIAPEYIWGVIVFGVGFVQFSSLVYHGYDKRKITCAMSLFVWWFIAGMFIISSRASTTTVIYVGIAIFTSWSFIRLLQRNNH